MQTPKALATYSEMLGTVVKWYGLEGEDAPAGQTPSPGRGARAGRCPS
jgi:hypothetical protein